jgi:hypothetical protein
MSDIKKLEQKRQEALDKANRLKSQIDKKLNGQKFVLGGMLMAIAENEPDRIPQILADIDKYVTRKADISRLEGFKSEIGNNIPKDTLSSSGEPNRPSNDDGMGQLHKN